MLDKYFNITGLGSNMKTEIVAGLTTFATMAYILAVNPYFLSVAGMDYGAVMTATALSAVIATLVMALVAKLPFALAPGMGLNAFFAFTVCGVMGCSWQLALTAVFAEGIIFLLLTFFNVREAIINSIPTNIKHAISVGIGLFIAFIGLAHKDVGIIVPGQGIPVHLGDLHSPGALLCILGIIVIGVLLVRKVKGAILIGLLAVTVVGLIPGIGVTSLPKDGALVSLPPSLDPIFFKFVGLEEILSWKFVSILFVFLFVDMFDTVGTLVGVASKADLLDKDGRVPRVKQALFADAIGTTVGAVMGTSTVTTYVESAAGVAEGGKTGMTSLTVAFMFFLALFFTPLFTMIPAAASSSVLVIIGIFMMSPITKINFDDYSEFIPAFLTMIMMPLSYSIAEGIAFGMLSYVVLKVLTGRYKELNIPMICIALIFVLKYIYNIGE
ncbi:NCS2 family permease [Ancylomarina salipaludis]|uniref:NCS2 family permease n=1 Tax=Ancylomarina salipaludis TaxID=2501299 RepID=A0A4Q1JP64_9BACT|nr:NCS2 family permease [Ancylomarina salipaludis]RXQ96524.1 NCS2 family permease [Ancylomarina salipaludis]